MLERSMADDVASVTLRRTRGKEGDKATWRHSGEYGSNESVDRKVYAVALFNVKYSPNLGDGIIAECLEFALSRARQSIEPVSLDLAGRGDYDANRGNYRSGVLSLIERCPGFLRRRLLPLVIQAVVRTRIVPIWMNSLASCQVAVFGGGNLLADKDQNFPIKLSVAIDRCKSMGIPIIISHVGVSEGWSTRGRTRFLSALSRAQLHAVTVRDNKSADDFVHQFSQLNVIPAIVPDPGLLSEEVFGRLPRPQGDRPRIGLGVISPLIVRLHSAEAVQGASLAQWFVDVAQKLAAAGNEVYLFTNGTPEDEEFCDVVAERLINDRDIHRSQRFVKPEQLALFISTLDCCIAHRLHACIIAYAYGVPPIGLRWDRKLDNFFTSIGQPSDLFTTNEASPDDIVAAAKRSIQNGVHGEIREAILNLCREGIDQLATQIVEAGDTR